MRRELCAVVCVAIVGVAVDSFACGFVGYGGSPTPRKAQPKKAPPRAASDRIADADRALEQGQLTSAIADARGVYPDLEARIHVSDDRLEIRAARTLALAFVRSGERGEKLAWAAAVLRDIAQRSHANDPASEADLAEALARSPATQREARDRLERLVAKDLVGSAHALAALATLRDEGPASELRARCAGMTTTPEICRAPAGKPPST